MSLDPFSDVPITSIPITDITIPEDRQRKSAKADEAFVTSIREQGLLNPIIVRADNVLVAGERRLDAFRQLSRTHIPARIFEHLTPRAAHLVELQENLARKQLSWQEEAKAIFDHHHLCLADYPAWTQQGTATEVGVTQSYLSRILIVAEQLADPDVSTCQTFTGAFNLLESRADRAIASATARGLMVAEAFGSQLNLKDATKEERTAALLDSLGPELTNTADAATTLMSKFEAGAAAAAALNLAASSDAALITEDRILTLSFHDWAPQYSGPKFDVIHCDFPYGKDYAGSNTRKTSTTAAPTYADEADIYVQLVDTFLTHQDTFALPVAHCLFWFDMLHYQWTIDQFRAAGWRLVQPHPLIWTKNYQGVASDPSRRPRHCYETALLFSRGDRKLRRLDQDHFEERVDEKLHLSQKPFAMLQHFLALLVDEHTAVLDPTCGSGSSLVSAHRCGANRLLGLELEPANADIARFILKRELGHE